MYFIRKGQQARAEKEEAKSKAWRRNINCVSWSQRSRLTSINLITNKLISYAIYLSTFGTLVRMISSMTVRTWAKASCWIASSSSNINCLAWKSTSEKHVKDLFCRHITFETMTRIVFVETGPPSPSTWARACYFWPVKVVLPSFFCIWQYLVKMKFQNYVFGAMLLVSN